jgi:hypothetical protein
VTETISPVPEQIDTQQLAQQLVDRPRGINRGSSGTAPRHARICRGSPADLAVMQGGVGHCA